MAAIGVTIMCANSNVGATRRVALLNLTQPHADKE
jgi:hypothetical protein